MRRVAVVLGVLALALGGSLSVQAEAPSAYGWWWEGNQRQLRPIQVPPPDYIPEDGLYIARDVDEAFAIAAMNYLAPEGPEATLELKIAPGSMTGIPLIAACPLTADFFPEWAGTWENKPIPNCDLGLTTGELIGQPATSIVWHLPEEFMVSPEYWNFVLKPDDQANPFQVAFEPPGDASFSVNAGSAFVDETPPPPPPPDGGSGFGDGSGFSSPPSGGSTFVPPATTTEEPPAATPQPTPGARDDIRSAGNLPRVPDDTTDRIVAALVFAGILGALLLAARQRGVPVLAGFGKAPEVGEPRARGLGRFAKPRDGRPRDLL